MILLFHRITIQEIISIRMVSICHHFHSTMPMEPNNQKHSNETKWVISNRLFQHEQALFSSLEWDHCQFHEDCGEGNCCYVHFRFRSLPKSFCRPNRNAKSDLCEPLTKYRSLKDVPAWKQHKQNSNDQQEVEEESRSLRSIYYGR